MSTGLRCAEHVADALQEGFKNEHPEISGKSLVAECATAHRQLEALAGVKELVEGAADAPAPDTVRWRILVLRQ
jgi:hypothetical protein